MTSFQQYTQPIERKITRQLLAAIFAVPGRSVKVFDGEERTPLIEKESEVYQHLATTGSDWILIWDETGKYIGGIWLVWGNGEDLISDWVALPEIDAIVEPVLDALGI